MPFETHDLYTAGYCLLQGHAPTCVPIGSRIKFVFADEVRTVASGFIMSPHASYADALRRLKQLMYATTQDTHTIEVPSNADARRKQ